MPRFLDGAGEELLRDAVRFTKNRPAGVPAPPQEKFFRSKSTRAVLVTGPAEGGYFPGKLQYRDSEDEEWADLTDHAGNAIEVWAIAYSGSDLTQATRYGGDLVSFHEGKAVYAATAGGGSSLSACLLFMDLAMSLPANNITLVNGWSSGSEQFDFGGYFNAGSPSKLTAPQDGYYLFGATVEITSPENDRRYSLKVRINGELSEPWIQSSITGATGSPQMRASVAGVWPLDAGDYIELQVQNGSPSFDTGLADSIFWIIQLGTTGGGGGSGTVTSVAATVPTGMTIAGSPITSAGTLAFGWAGGDSWIDEVDGGTL